MNNKQSDKKTKATQSSSNLIIRRAPSKRTAINEFQAKHLCGLCRLILQQAMSHFEVESTTDLQEEGWGAFTELPEYELFTAGTYACGFVCSDLTPDVDLDTVKCRPREVLSSMTLPQLRHYVHTLMRSERAGYGYGSVIYEALRAGVIEALCERLERGSDLYESL